MISIVIPTYRRVEILGDLLATVRLQAAQNGFCEILVVDNDPDGSAEDLVRSVPDTRYVHEPTPGVVHARNRGIDEAKGTYIVFLDDDEIPAEGWLAAFDSRVKLGDRACFGRIEPLFLEEPPQGLRESLANIFSRGFDRPTGGDVTDYRAYLGTGNSMFHKADCFGDGMRFDPRFNAGGEDVWLIRRLVEEKGIALAWSNEALVEEIVPPSRMTATFVRARKFHDGVLRCVVERGRGGIVSFGRVSLWMGVGFVQSVVFGILGLALKLLRVQNADSVIARAAGGVGKLLWWSDPRA